ncbi:hypothetical protein HK104_007458 [Borealophlyctis nickersoniae]|nr:hypothetical protein HK104_007458 [Borealophlyctis nickersoniae]
MLRHGTNLVTLDLRKCRATDHHMIIRAIGVTCPNLERIIFGGSLCEDPKLREAHLEGLANGCSKLRVVRIVGKNANMHLHASGLPSLFAHCKNLETVKIKRLCCFEYSTTFRTIIRSIAENNKHLRRIHFDLKYPAATSSDLILLAASCPDLRFLHLQPAPSFKDSGIRILATACPKLETVNLSSASSITDESIWALSWYCTSLTRVDVSRCPGLTTKSLTYFSSCKNLKSLTFNHTFDYLFDAGVIFKEVKGVVEGTQLVRLAFTVATGMSGDCPEQYRCRPRLGEDAARFVVKPGPVVSVHTDVDGTGNNNNPCTCGWDGSLHLAATGRERVIALGNLQIVDPIGEMLKAGMEWRHAIRKVLSRFANDALLSMGLAGVMEAATEAAAEAAEASAVYAAAARVVATQVGVGESGGET